MIRVQLEVGSVVLKAGLEAVLGGRADIELVEEPSEEVDVLLTDQLSELSMASFPVVLLTEAAPVDAVRLGARAVVSRDAPPAQIIAAICAAASGLTAVPFEDSAALFPSSSPEPLTEHLTPREMEVLEMLGEGYSNKEIAFRLKMSEHTAKFHLNSILAKLGAGTRTEAVIRGIRLGLVKL